MSSPATFTPYTYLTYDQMRAKLLRFAIDHERYVRLSTVENDYGIKHRVRCGDKRCQIDIVTLTDSESQKVKSQVYISGEVHGNEMVGPGAAAHFIEYMAKNAPSDYEISRILSEVEFIITPLTNASGYYNGRREEELTGEAKASYGHWYIDPNRDFPYNQASDT